MIIYIDTDYKCHANNANGLVTVETDIFDGKCAAYIEGYRFIPVGQSWTRHDGAVFNGEMVAPFVDIAVLQAAQNGYEAALAEIEEALNE